MVDAKILSQQQVNHLKEITIEENLAKLGLLVIHQRHIPDYYIRRQCITLGSDPNTVRTWVPTGWVTNIGRVTITDPQIQQVAFLALQAINQRLAHHPAGEPYLHARARLQKELHQLVLQGVRRSRISELTELNHKTIRSALEYSYGQATHNAHCPWDLLDRIAAIDWEPHSSPDQPDEGTPTQPIKESEIQRLRHTDQQFRSAVQPEMHYVKPGDPCWRCDSLWASLQPQPQTHENSLITLTCRVCARESYMLPSSLEQ